MHAGRHAGARGLGTPNVSLVGGACSMVAAGAVLVGTPSSWSCVRCVGASLPEVSGGVGARCLARVRATRVRLPW